MAATTELYTILVQTTGATSEVRNLVTQLDRSNRALRETQRTAGNYSGTVRDVTREQRMFALQMQNTGYQVQDFFVQVASGTSATRALGQQLPQMLQGFGLWGVAIGTTVAAIGALLPALRDMWGAVQLSDDLLKDFGASLQTLQSQLEIVRTPVNELQADFGAFAESIRELNELGAELTLKAMQEQVKAINTEFGKFLDFQVSDLEAFEKMEAALARILEQQRAGVATAEQVYAAQEAVAIAQDAITKNTGLTVDEAVRVRDVFGEINEAMKAGDLGEGFVAAVQELAALTEGKAIAANVEEAIAKIVEFANRQAEALKATDEFSTALPAFWGMVSSAVSDAASAQDKARQSAEAYATALDLMATAPDQFSTEQFEAMRQLLAEATLEAMGFGNAYREIQTAIDGVRTEQEKAAEAADRLATFVQLAKDGLIELSAVDLAALEEALRRQQEEANGVKTATDALNTGLKNYRRELLDLANGALAKVSTEQQKAADYAGQLQEVLDAVGRGLISLDPRTLQAVREALAQARAEADGTAAAVARVQAALNNLDATAFSARTSAELARVRRDALAAGASIEGALNEQKLYEARQQYSQVVREGTEAERYVAYQNLRMTEAALREQQALNAESEAILDARREAEKAAKGGGGGGGKSDQQKELEEARKDVEAFIKSMRTEAETMASTIADVMADLQALKGNIPQKEYEELIEQAGVALQRLREQSVELNEIGQVVNNAFGQLFDDLVDRTKTAGEAFRDFLGGMATDIAKFLFSQQVMTFLKNFGALTGGSISGGHLFGGAAWGPSAAVTAATGGANFSGVLTPPVTSPIATQSNLRAQSAAPVVRINNYAPVDVKAEQGTDSTGQRTLDIQINQRMAQALRSGALDPVLANDFGVTRRAR